MAANVVLAALRHIWATLILKMNAGRLIDRADAAALLRLNRADLDLAYLLRWVAQLKLAVEWVEIWNEAFPHEPAPEAS